MAAGGNVANIQLGPGRLYVAALGVAEPASVSAALPSANWITIGYTEEGTAVSTEMTSEAIEVAEELDPVLFVQTRRTTSVTFSMAEATKKRLFLAVGGGAGGFDDTIPFEFPDASEILPVQIIWDLEDTPTNLNRRWLFRRATPSGTIEIPRRKAPAKTLIGVTFDCAKSLAGLKAVKVFPNVSGQV